MRDTFNKKRVIRVNFSLALLIARFVSRFLWNFFLSKQAKILADQAPVVQTMDSAFHRINHYPADKH